MGLSCNCHDYDPEPGDVNCSEVKDYAPLATKRSRRCWSCQARISVGETCCEVTQYKVPETEIECRIYGEDGEIPRASQYLCERCADLAFSLGELGYCVQPWEDQRELVAEYAEQHTVIGEANGTTNKQ